MFNVWVHAAYVMLELVLRNAQQEQPDDFQLQSLRVWAPTFMLARFDEPRTSAHGCLRSYYFMMVFYRTLHLMCYAQLVAKK